MPISRHSDSLQQQNAKHQSASKKHHRSILTETNSGDTKLLSSHRETSPTDERSHFDQDEWNCQ
jgi:hypothetical protein